MTDDNQRKGWIRASIQAITQSQWFGIAGHWFRITGDAVKKYNDDHVHIEEKIQQAPDAAWNTLQIKSSQTELNLAQVEEKKIAAEFARRTMTARARQEEATADLAETNAQLGRIKLAEAWVDLSKKLKDAGVMLNPHPDGRFTLYPAPQSYDFKALEVAVEKQLLSPADEPTPARLPSAFTIQQSE